MKHVCHCLSVYFNFLEGCDAPNLLGKVLLQGDDLADLFIVPQPLIDPLYLLPNYSLQLAVGQGRILSLEIGCNPRAIRDAEGRLPFLSNTEDLPASSYKN